MDSAVMYLAVQDLVTDLPVDEATVEQKVISLKEHGLIQPLTVWYQDHRIIDGFHRLEAARRLGWNTIPCNVIECDEEGFWDARIQSARQHHEVEDSRLLVWIEECWKATPWAKEYLNEGDSNPYLASLLRALWDIDSADWQQMAYGLSRLSTSGKQNLRKFWDSLDEQERGIVNWVAGKIELWGISWPTFKQCIFASYAPHESNYTRHETLNRIANEQEWSLSRRVKESRNLGDIRTPGAIRAYFDNRIGDETYLDYKARCHEESQAKYEKEQAARKAERQKPDAIRTELMHKIYGIEHDMSQHRAQIQAMPDVYDLLMGLAEWATKKCAELWPDATHEGVETNPIALENIRLRQELAIEHNKRVSAEAQLVDKEDRAAKLAEKLPGVIAWSSVQL